ncbi:AlkA N-terminal domain-containing protein [soil metagenome]
MTEDPERCFRAVKSRDRRFDGWFVVAISSTKIYCRPSCPAVTPKRAHVRFYATAAAAQGGGYRACKRCRPDASPGSPEWNVRADLVGRAMRLLADGVVDREGVSGLARRLHLSERHLHRELVSEVGAGPQALARAQRAETARVLIETTDLPFAEVAFAAGFASIRQFNETVRTVFAGSPSELRKRRVRGSPTSAASISLRLPCRRPFAGAALLEFLGARAVPGIEEFVQGTYRRSLLLPHGDAVVELAAGEDHVRCVLSLNDMRDLAAAVQRCRRLLDLDADPVAVDAALAADPALGPTVRAMPGLRVPGAVDGNEAAIRAVLGQQVTIAAARSLAARLVSELGKPLTAGRGGVTHLWPEAQDVTTSEAGFLPVPGARRASVVGLARALAAGDIALDSGADRAEVERRLLALRGVGPWTASYIAMRALGDPDAFLPTDAGVHRALERLGVASDPASAERHAQRWRPWRSYAVQYLWSSLRRDGRK